MISPNNGAKTQVAWELWPHPYPEVALEMSEKLRQSDRDEIWASGFHTPAQALIRSLDLSTESFAGVVNGEVICMFGVGAAGIATGMGSPWMLGTDGVDRYWKTFAGVSRWWIDDLRPRYAVLYNHVDARNDKSIRWLDWLGFKIYPAAPHGPRQMPFHFFELVGGLP